MVCFVICSSMHACMHAIRLYYCLADLIKIFFWLYSLKCTLFIFLYKSVRPNVFFGLAILAIFCLNHFHHSLTVISISSFCIDLDIKYITDFLVPKNESIC